MRYIPCFLLSVLVFLSPLPASAQRSIDIERFVPTPDGEGFFSITGTRTPGPWRWNTAVWLSYAHRPLVLETPAGREFAVVSDRLNANLLFQLGLLGRFAFVLDLSGVLFQDGDTHLLSDSSRLAPVVFRDPRMAFRARILGEDATEDRARHEGEGLALQAAITVPMGNKDQFASEGQPQLEGQMIFDFHVFDFGIGMNLGWRHRFAEPVFYGAPFRNQLFFGFGLKSPGLFIEHVNWIAELTVTTDGETPFGQSATTQVEWLLGGRTNVVRDTEFSLAIGTGLTSGVGAPVVRLVGGFSFAPRVHDRDHDGVMDDQDPCPRLPEDFDGHMDDDGCPEPDNDGDLIPDLDDACPNDEADFDLDLDEDGCNDPDSDGDGVLDPVDGCPVDAEDLDGFEDEDGCPEVDDDGDAVPDAADACRTDPEDPDGFEDADGCPDLDDDRDGIADSEDRCPREPEDRDGFEDTDGCPDFDNDHDGVLDADDRCSESETINGRSDDDGCPDRGDGVWRLSAAIVEPSFTLVGRIRFTREAIHPSALAALVELTQYLRARRSVSGDPIRIVLGGGTEERARILAEYFQGAERLPPLRVVSEPGPAQVRVEVDR